MNDATAPSPRNKALDLLARREHSVAELRAKLLVREFDSASIDEAIDQLVGEGLVSDARFADAFVTVISLVRIKRCAEQENLFFLLEVWIASTNIGLFLGSTVGGIIVDAVGFIKMTLFFEIFILLSLIGNIIDVIVNFCAGNVYKSIE